MATEEIYDAFRGEYEEFKSFFHGHTYTANPLACRAAVASLELFEKNNILAGLSEKINFLEDRLKDFYQIPIVGDIRQVGLMIGIELVKDKKTKQSFEWKDKIGIRMAQKAKEKGIMIRPLGSVIVLMPPLAMKENDLSKLLNITHEAIETVGASLKSAATQVTTA